MPEMLSNQSCAIRVLNIPGFSDSHCDGTSDEVAKKDFQTTRKILAIQEELDIKFHKVLFFLPQGGLKKADGYTQSQLRNLYNHFGSNGRNSEDYQIREDKKQQNIQKHQRIFHVALEKVLFGKKYGELKNPPKLVFIPANAESDKIVEDIGLLSQGDGMKLSFNSDHCYKCQCDLRVSPEGHFDDLQEIKTKFPESKPSHQYAKMNKGSEELFNEEVLEVSLDNCHVAFKPKYSKLEKFSDGVVFVVTIGIVHWLVKKTKPKFFNNEEICIYCRQPPGSEPCYQVGQECKITLDSGETVRIPVQHRNQKQEIQAVKNIFE